MLVLKKCNAPARDYYFCNHRNVVMLVKPIVMNARYTIAILLLSFQISASSFGQADRANLKQALEAARELADQYRLEEAARAYEELLPAVESTKDIRLYIKTANELGEVYYFSGNRQEITVLLNKTLELSTKATELRDLEIETRYQLSRYYTNVTYDMDKAYKVILPARKQAQKLYGENHPVSIKVNRVISVVLSELRRMDESLQWKETVLKRSIETFGEMHFRTVEAYNNLGVHYLLTEDYTTAKDIFEKAQNITESLLSSENIFSEQDRLAITYVYMNLSTAYLNLGYVDEAIEYTGKALENCPQRTFIGKASYNGNMLNQGRNYESKGDYITGLEYHKSAYELNAELFGADHPETGEALINLGVSYTDLGAYEKAKTHLYQAEQIYKNTKGNIRLQLSLVYNGLGNVFFRQNNYEQAIKYYQKALDINLNANRYHSALSQCMNLGMTYMECCEDHKNSMQYYNQARTLLQSIFGGDPDSIPIMYIYYYNVGILELNRNNYKAAEKNFRQSAELLRLLMGENNGLMSEIYFPLAKSLRHMGKFDEAFQVLEKGMKANTVNAALGKPAEGNDIIQPNIHFKLLSEKAMLYVDLFERDKKEENLLKAYNIFKDTEPLLKEVNKFYTNFEDRIQHSEALSLFYQQATRIAYRLFEITGDEQYARSCFYYSESNRAQTLAQAVNDELALQFADLPDSLRKKEYRLRIALSHLRAQLLEARNTQNQIRTDSLQNTFYATNQEYQSFLVFLENKFPNYYALKHNDPTTDISTIQEEILDPQSALIEYHLGDSLIHIFTITKEGFTVKQLNNRTEIEAMLVKFRSGIQESLEERWRFTDKQDFWKANHQIYKQLAEPAIASLPRRIKKLIIIPSQKLGYLPFETLITQFDEKEKLDYRRMPFLLYRYTINYHYSARLLAQSQRLPANRNTKYAGFAPAYATKGQYPEKAVAVRNNAGLSAALGEGLLDLPGAKASVTEAAHLFNGDAYLDYQATEQSFKQNARKYGILHLAMHGFVDNLNPLYSALIFSASEDDDEDGYLNAFELYNMDLNTQLAVLGACNTNYGQIKKGVGIMSMARAFAYAGCPSLVASLWSVPDEASSQIMRTYFAALKEGLPKDEALRQAKLNYLKDSPNRLASPIYWAGLVSIGDNQPIIQKHGRLAWPFYTLGILLAILLAVWIFKRLVLQG